MNKDVYDHIFKALLNNQHWAKETEYGLVEDYAKDHGVQIKRQDIYDYMSAVKKDKEEKIYSERFNKKFVFNFRGGWFFDIGFNRKDRFGNVTADGLGKWAVFVNGNSGWAYVHALNSRKAEDIQDAIDTFINECNNGLRVQLGNNKFKTITYPVKKIVSDAEGGVPGGEYKGVQIDKHATTETGHRFMGRIDAFMSGLRKHAFNAMRNDKFTTWIPVEIVDDFINMWNVGSIPGVKCKRSEMMCDEKLEEAYICAALYNNADVQEGFENFVEKGYEVKLKDIDRQNPFGNRQARARNEMPGTYKISVQEGQTIATDVNDPNKNYIVRPNDIKATIYTNKFFDKEQKRLANISDDINIQVINQPSNIRYPTKKKRAEPSVAEVLADNNVLDAVASQLVLENRNEDFQRTIPTNFNPGDMQREQKIVKEKIQQAVREADNPKVQASGRKHPMITRSMDNPDNILQDTVGAGEAPRGDINEVQKHKMNKLTEKEKATQERVVKLHKQAKESEKRIREGAQEHITNILIEQAKVSPMNTQAVQVAQEKLTNKRGFNKPSQFVNNQQLRTIFSRHERALMNKGR